MAAGSLQSAAPEAATAAATIPSVAAAPGRILAGARLPLSFILFGLAWLAIAASWFAARAELLGFHHATPGTVALVHAWILGCLLPIVFGAVYQLLPVVLGVELANPALAWVHFALHAIGAPCLIAAMIVWRMDFIALAAVPVALGSILFCSNVWRTVGGRRWSHDPVSAAFALSAGWLVAAVLAGELLALNRMWYFLPLSPLALLRTHAHIGVVGFFLTLLQGATFRLVPMFTLSSVKCWRRVWAGLLVTQAGLIGLIPALAWEQPAPIALSALAICSGLAVSGWEMAATLAARNKRGLVPGLRGFVGGAALAGGAATIGLALAFAGARPAFDNPRWAVLYGVFALLGGLVPMMLGMLCKIVPFLVWLRVYAPLIGRRPTPPATGLAQPLLERTWLVLHGLGLGWLAAGVVGANGLWLRLGAWLMLAGITSLLVNFGIIFSHLGHARAPRPQLTREPALS